MNEAVAVLHVICTIYAIYPKSISVAEPSCLVSLLLSFLFLQKLLVRVYRDVFRTL